MSDYPNPSKDFCYDNYAQCKRCKKRACNSNRVEFEEKISCVKCTPDKNSNCNVVDDSAKAKECAPTTIGYKDMCYTFQKGGVSHRGCLYEAPTDIFVECKNPFSEACLTCNKTNCNRKAYVNEELTLTPYHYEVVQENGESKLVQCDDLNCKNLSPWQRFCYKCDSNVNSNCTNQLDDSMIGICDFEQEDLGCYHMITETGVTRGCVKDLENELKETCLANNETCKTCIELNCNSRSNFSECLVTDEDQSRAWNKYESLSSPKVCKNYIDECFIQVIEEDTVIRGCLSDYAAQNDLPLNFLNQVENNKTYEICSGSLCNDKEVKPLYCLSCNSTDKRCAEPFDLYLRKRCQPLEINPAGCYHFEDGINNTYYERGCITHLDGKRRADCESDSDTCKKCFGNECNSKKKFMRCVWSINDNTVQLPNKLCQRYEDSCVIFARNGAVRRGCYSELVEEIGFDYNDRGNRDIFEGCQNENCNNRKIESEYCMVCSSEMANDNNKCRYNPTDDMRQKCPVRLRKLGCYLQLEKSTKRGCVSELNKEDRIKCRTGDTTCKICNGEYCNKKRSFERCKSCISSDDEDCMDKPWISADRTCPNYLDSCYTHVQDGVVRRNCIGDGFINSTEQCNNSEHCLPCSDDYKCNGEQITPEICYSCDSHVNATCKNISWLDEKYYVQECPISIRKQGCYHLIEKENKRHERGMTQTV